VAPHDAGVGRGREGCELRTILVVEDEPKILRIVCDYLDRAGFRSVEAVDGRSALQLAQRDRPDLVVLDLGLPDMDGLDVIRRLRERSRVPVVVLTARGEESDRLVGLELGADDYVVKPFSPKEVVARVRAVLRRTERAAEPGRVVRAGDVTVDLDRMSVTAGERAVELTRTEIQLLATLAREPGRVFTRAQLLDAIHGVEVDSYERAIDAHVKNIRRKLESDPRRPRYLLTVHAVGYRFAES
jgi:two-component system alkaline phosphatase synthesis response regulator PhoP